MAELGAGGGTGYPSVLDTDNTQESSSTTARSDVPNDLAAAIVAVQKELGTDPAGSLTTVKAFLQTEHDADGTHGAITASTISGTAISGTTITATGDVIMSDTKAIEDDSNNEWIIFSKTGTAVNEITIANAATGNAPAISATGGDANIDLSLSAKGTGTINLDSPLGSWPGFSVNRNGADQENVTGEVKVNFDTEAWDEGPCFGADSAGSASLANRFNPGTAGKYLLTAVVAWKSVTAGDQLELHYYKNTAPHKQKVDFADDTTHVQTFVIIVDMNGTTDQIELYAENTDRNTSDIDGSANQTFWMGQRVG
jgi:hypothetical protein